MSTYIFKKKEKGAKENISCFKTMISLSKVSSIIYSMELKLIRSISAEKLKQFSDNDITAKGRFSSKK